MSTTAQVKVAKVRQWKKIFAVIAVIIILVVAISIVYVDFFSYNNSTDNIKLSFSGNVPTEINPGSYAVVQILVQYDARDHVTLSTDYSWATFVLNVPNGEEHVSQITVTGGQSYVNLAVNVPNAPAGQSYQVFINANNSGGAMAYPLTFSFNTGTPTP